MFDIALKNLQARKLRTFFTVFAITMAVLLFATFGALQASFEDLLYFMADPLEEMDLVVVLEKGNSFVDHDAGFIGEKSSLVEAKYLELIDHPAISPYLDLQRTGRVLIRKLDGPGGDAPTYRIWGIPPLPDGQYHPETFLGRAYEGVSRIADARLEEGPHFEAVFAAGAAEHFGVTDKVHQTVTLKTGTGQYTLYVDKVLSPSPSLESFHDRFEYSVIMTLGDAHELFGDDQISYIRVVPQGIGSVDLAGLINENIAGVDAKTHKEVMRDLRQSMGPMQIGMDVLKYFVLGIAVLTILNTFFMAARERVKEVATLKACGATNRVIVEIFLSEALLISLLGSGLGIALSMILLIVLAVSTGTASMVKTIPLAPLAMGFLVGLTTGPLAAIAPAIISARQDPIRGLRYE